MDLLMFVYGTLRKDARGQVLSPLCRGWVFKRYGSVPGELYDFGAYPGAVPSASVDARILGELYELPDPATMLPLIDEYEGCGEGDSLPQEFERALVEVDAEDGSVARAWIYWYRLRPVVGRRVASGDYLQRYRSGPWTRYESVPSAPEDDQPQSDRDRDREQGPQAPRHPSAPETGRDSELEDHVRRRRDQDDLPAG